MSDWPNRGLLVPGEPGFVSTNSSLLGLNTTAIASTAWPSANYAAFVPIRLSRPYTAYKMVVGAGATAAGNFDVGLYDRYGNRLVSSGATAKGASTEHVLDITDTRIGPGLYYMALAADGTNNYVSITPSGTAPVPLQKTRAYGVLGMAAAYTLPDPATFAAAAFAQVPAIAVLLRPY